MATRIDLSSSSYGRPLLLTRLARLRLAVRLHRSRNGPPAAGLAIAALSVVARREVCDGKADPGAGSVEPVIHAGYFGPFRRFHGVTGEFWRAQLPVHIYGRGVSQAMAYLIVEDPSGVRPPLPLPGPDSTLSNASRFAAGNRFAEL